MNVFHDHNSRPVQGHFLQPCAKSSQGEFRHVLGQLPSALNCDFCGHTMVSLLALDVADGRLELGMLPVDRLPLLTCREHFHTDFQYSFTSAGEGLEFENERAGFVPSSSSARLTAREPQQVSLHAIPDRIVATRKLAREGRIGEAADWTERFEWDQPQHEVGGLPLRLNRDSTGPDCSLCEQPMPFLAAVVVEVQTGLNEETGLGQLLYFLCRTCACVAVVPDFESENYS